MAAIVGCDIHPFNNRRILEALRKQFGCDELAINAWCAQWIGAGFDTIECRFRFGDAPGLADAYLLPQVESARRAGAATSRWPNIMAVDEVCAALPAFADAAPLRQVDAPFRA